MSDQAHPGTESETNLRIIQAALLAFTQNGYKGCSTRAIAEQAGVNEVTLFRHFGSKLGLLKAAVDYSVSQMRVPTDIDRYLAQSFREGLSCLMRDYLVQLSNQSDILMLGFAESFSHPEIADVLKQFIWKIRTALLHYFEGQFERNQMKEADFPVLAHMVLITIHSAQSVHRRSPDEIAKHLNYERVMATVVDTLSRAYGNEE